MVTTGQGVLSASEDFARSSSVGKSSPNAPAIDKAAFGVCQAPPAGVRNGINPEIRWPRTELAKIFLSGSCRSEHALSFSGKFAFSLSYPKAFVGLYYKGNRCDHVLEKYSNLLHFCRSSLKRNLPFFTRNFPTKLPSSSSFKATIKVFPEEKKISFVGGGGRAFFLRICLIVRSNWFEKLIHKSCRKV